MKDENQEAVAELYSLGSASLKSQDWQNAMKCFKDVLAIDPEHEGAIAGLQEAKKRLYLADSYEKGQRAFDDGMWEEAIGYFEEVFSLSRNYKDAVIKLREAKKQKELLTLYELGSQHYRKEEWPRAIELFEMVVSLDPRYRDAAAMLKAAKKKEILAANIEYPNEMRSELAHRFPERGLACFYIGSRLIVHERQAAVFFRDGHALDVFGFGQHTISTDNIPLLISSIGEDLNEEMPISAEIYYVSMREFVGGWGTRRPTQVEDSRYGPVSLVGNGSYSYVVSNPQQLVERISGHAVYLATDIQDYFRERLVRALSELLSCMCKDDRSVLEIISSHQEIAAGVLAKVQEDFNAMGTMLTRFYISEIFLHDKSVEALQEREREMMKIKAESTERIAEFTELLESRQHDVEEMNDALRRMRRELDRLGFLFRLFLGAIVAVIGIGSIFILPSALSWSWLLKHTSKLGLQASATFGMLGISWVIVDTDKNRRWFALGSVVLAAISAVLQLL